MNSTYQRMLEIVRKRKEEIKEIALELDSFNAEWIELEEMEGSLIRLIKITKDRD